MTSISIGHHEILPGEKRTIELPLPTLYDSTPLGMPVHVIRGKKPGPTLCITAAIHGDEINGVEIVRRLMKKPILKSIAGTLLAIPIVNVYGFFNQNRYLMDRRDLNRSFPGSKSGSLAARLADIVTADIVSLATHCIDLHSGSLHRSNLPHIRIDFNQGRKLITLARAFNAPVVLQAETRAGTLRSYADSQRIPYLLYEAGESLRFNEFAIRSGVSGILNVMRKLKMVNPKATMASKVRPALAKSSYWLRASSSGILKPYKRLGQKVNAGDTIAIIANPTGADEHKLVAPISGIIIGVSKLPLVYEGAALYHIASFKKLGDVTEQIESLHELYSDTLEIFT